MNLFIETCIAIGYVVAVLGGLAITAYLSLFFCLLWRLIALHASEFGRHWWYLRLWLWSCWYWGAFFGPVRGERGLRHRMREQWKYTVDQPESWEEYRAPMGDTSLGESPSGAVLDDLSYA
jgi:hypothetical protein